MNDRHVLPGFQNFPEPDLLFHPSRDQDRHKHPLLGLLNFGPFSQSLVNHVLDPIKVAMIAPSGALDIVDGFLDELESTHSPRERPSYLPEFPGLQRVFGLRAVSAPDIARIELPDALNSLIASASKPHLVLADAIARAATTLHAHRSVFDAVMIYLPDAWEGAFVGSSDEDFDLHDYIKATLASLGIPSQILTEGSALRYACRASVMWRLSIALYCKAGGVPWKLANAPVQTAYVGLGYGLRPARTASQPFVVCCSQVFDADGAGLDFVAYETGDARIEDRDSPYLTRAEMLRVMSRSLSLYQRRHAGESPKHVVVHKSTEFKPDEIDGCFDAWGGVESLELIQVQGDTPWRALEIEIPRTGGGKGVPGGYTVHRGSMLQLSGREALLWTQGNAPMATLDGRNYFKEGKGIAAPLLLRRFAGHASFDDACTGVLGLSKMDWNNDALYDRLPATLTYASILSKTARRIPNLAPDPYPFRFFI